MKPKQAYNIHMILRYLCISCVILFGVISIIGSGGGGGDGIVPDNSNPCGKYLEIKSPTEDSIYTTTFDSISLSGESFGDDTGISVTWLNSSTGQSGTFMNFPRNCCFFGCWLCGYNWIGNIPLQVGDNKIEVTATDPDDRCGVDSLLVTKLASYTVSGRVLKIDDSAYPGVTVKIEGDIANAQDTTQTDENGYYELKHIPEGTYELTLTTDCNTDIFSPENQQIVVISGDLVLDYVYALPNPATYSVEGTITFQDGSATQDVTVNLMDDSLKQLSVTDPNGGYVLSNIPNGIYTLLPKLTGYGFSPDTREAVLCANNLTDQDFVAIPSGDLKWDRRYGSSGSDYVAEVKATPDNGLIVAGFSNSFSEGYDGWALKLDENGHVVWQKSYGRPYTSPCWEGSCPIDEILETVGLTLDGGYVMAGKADVSGEPAPWVLKLDANGNVIWQKTYAELNISGEVRTIQPMSDGSYIVAGNIDGSGSQAIWIAKLDASGNIIWQSAYIDEKAYSNTGKATVYSIQQTTDDGYILVGETYNLYYLDSYNNAFILKLDANGALEWSKSFADITEGFRSVCQTADGDYIAAGGIIPPGKLLLVKIKSNGEISWQKTYSDHVGLDITSTPDGNYLVVTESSIIKLDAHGNGYWKQPLGYYMNYANRNYPNGGAAVMQDGRYVAFITNSPSEGYIYDIIAKVYDSSGNDCTGHIPDSVSAEDTIFPNGDSVFEAVPLTVTASPSSITPINTSAYEIKMCFSD